MTKLCSGSKDFPYLEYITAIESACQKLQHQDVEELRADVNRTIRNSHVPKPNLNKEELKAQGELRRDINRTILTMNKGVAMVAMDKKEYLDKANILLVQPAYKSIYRGPTNKLKTMLITILKRIKRESGLQDGIYKTMYPMRCTSLKFYGLPEIHKTNTPSVLLYLVVVQLPMG